MIPAIKLGSLSPAAREGHVLAMTLQEMVHGFTTRKEAAQGFASCLTLIDQRFPDVDERREAGIAFTAVILGCEHLP